MGQKSGSSQFRRIERKKSLKVPPDVLNRKAGRVFIRPLASPCWGRDLMVSGQFRQERHTTAQG